MAATNLDTITAFLRGKGLTPAQIAGVEGNLQTESGLNPSAHNAGENATGIAQWEGGRLTALQNFAKTAGTPVTDLNTQLGFMWSELTGTEHAALVALQATTTPAAAATAFDQKYERSSAASLPARIANANAIAGGAGLGFTGNGSGGSSAGTGSSGSSSSGMPSWLSGIVSWFSDTLGITDLLTAIGHWIIDGILILLGAGFVLFAFYLIAKGGENASSSGSPVVDVVQDSKAAGKREHDAVTGGAEDGAGDLAAVAA